MTLELPERMFQMAHLHMVENNCQIILKSIHNCRSYGPGKFGQMDAPTHAHTPTITMTTMSCTLQVGSTKSTTPGQPAQSVHCHLN